MEASLNSQPSGITVKSSSVFLSFSPDTVVKKSRVHHDLSSRLIGFCLKPIFHVRPVALWMFTAIVISYNKWGVGMLPAGGDLSVIFSPRITLIFTTDYTD